MLNVNNFTELGISDDLANKCVDLANKSIKDYVPYTRFKEINDDRNKLKETIKDYDKQLESLKNSNTTVEDLKSTISELQANNKKNEQDYQAKIKEIKINNAIETALKDANARNIKAVQPFLDINSLELLEDGTIPKLEKQIQELANSESTSFLFKTPENNVYKGVDVSVGASSSVPINLDNMSYDQLVQHLAENPTTV